MTNKTRRGIDAGLKAKIALEALGGDGHGPCVALRGPSQPGLRLEEAASGSSCAGVRSWRGAGAETTHEREIERLHAKIGQLTVERDLYEGLPVKGFFAFYTIAASNVVVRTDRSFGLAGLLDGIDLLRCERAPGASTYIRQLHDGLPQSCMHDPNDRRDGFTLFTGVMKGANRCLDFPSPRLRGRSARSLIDMSVQVSVRPRCS